MYRATLVLAFLAIAALPADAAGLLFPRSGGEPIRIESHRVTATVTDGVAKTKIRQTFVNRQPAILEAIYVFPLPENAALVDVAMEVDGKRLEGLLAERRQARLVYDRIVRGRRDPALVEKIGRGKFRLSVFPVMPNQPTVVEISYLQHLPLEGGKFRYVYPLAHSGKSTETTKDLTISVTLRSSVPFTGVRADAKDAAISRKAPGEAVVSLERSRAMLDRDLVVTGSVAVTAATLNVRTFVPKQGDGYFTATLTPPPLNEEMVLPRDVVLVLDTSGSMAEENRIEQAKAAARHLIRGLRPQDRANILLFDSGVTPFAKQPVPATKKNIEALKEFISGIQAGGGTAFGEALAAAAQTTSTPGRVPLVVLLTDGKPTIGETRPQGLIELAKEGGENGLAFYPFGVGSDVDAGLLRGIARATGGRAEIFRPGHEVKDRVTAFLDRTGAPAVTEVKMTVPGITLYDVFPRPIPVTGQGEQVVLCGRYKGATHSKVIVSAILGNAPITLTALGRFDKVPGGDPAVRDLYAQQKLDFLEEELRIRSGLNDKAYFAAIDRGRYSTKNEIVEEIIAVSLIHGVQSAYTSFIVLLPEDRKRIDPRDIKALTDAVERIRKKKGGGELSDAGSNSGLPYEESLGVDDFISDAPFDGPSTGASIGIGGGAGGSFGGRYGTRHLRAKGCDEASEAAVDQGLRWLAEHQKKDGSWEGPPANTGLAVLAFLGAGQTHKHGKHRKVVKAGLRRLKQTQRPDGCFADAGKPDFLRDHAIMTQAMCEAYALTGSPLFKLSSQNGIDYLHKAQVPFFAWGRGIRVKPADPETTFWATCALKSAKSSGGLWTSQDAFDGVKNWIAKTKLPEGHAGGGVLALVFCGEDPKKSERIKQLLPLCTARPPAVNEGAIRDISQVYFGTLATFQAGKGPWEGWNARLRKMLLASQGKETKELGGSWAAAGPEGKRLGRAGATAMATMSLEIYYRYAKVFRD